MKTIKQIFKDTLAWWEKSLEDDKFRITLHCILIGLVVLGVILVLAFPSSAATEPSEPTQKYLTGHWQFVQNPSLPDTYLSESNLTFRTPSVPNESNTLWNILSFRPTYIAVGTGNTHDADLYQNNTYVAGFDRNIYFEGLNPVSDVFYSAFTSIAQPINIDPIISDLTGYTVTVPSGWSATAGYGMFDLSGTFYNELLSASLIELGDFNIGYNTRNVSTADTIGFFSPSVDIPWQSNLIPSYSLLMNITGGLDSSNPSLIQWLYNNNATFSLTNPPVDPQPESVTLPAGIYYMQNIYNDTRGTISFNKPFISGDSLYYTGIEFVGYQDNQYTQVNYTFTLPLPEGTAGPPAPPVAFPIYNGVDGFENIANCIIILQVDETLTAEEAVLFNEVFIPVNEDNKLINLYNGALKNGNAFGYDMGYDTGYTDGFNDGVSNSGGSFFGNFIESILNALDKLVLLPGNISFLDIIKAIGGLFVVIWLLKLLAGG